MSVTEKKIKKFLKNPKSTKYSDIVNLLLHFGFGKVSVKGSHMKFKHYSLQSDLIIPVHNNECKDFYKLEISKIIKRLKK